MRNGLAILVVGSALTIESGTAAAHDNISFSLSFGAPTPVVTDMRPALAYYTPVPLRVVYYRPAPVVYYGPMARFVYVDRQWIRRHHDWKHP